MEPRRRSGKLAVILHADIAGSTALVQQDEDLAHERIQDSFRRFSETITKYHGHVRELRGDALLAEFERASDAVPATLAFQTEQTEHTSQLNDAVLPIVRVGIAMGEVIVADNTVTGAGVVLAQRVEQLAEPGGLCITGAIHEALPQRMPFVQANLGEQQIKGFDEPIRVYRVELNPGEPIPPPVERSQPEASLKRRGLIVAIAVFALVVAGGASYWFKPWVPQEKPATVERMALPLPDKPSIAVLPFSNMSDDPQQEYFVDGMTEDLITDLSKLSGLFVIARNSVFTYKGKPVKVRQVAEELGVRYVLEGSVRRAGNQVRINAQLIDATTDGHLWAERYDGSLQDIFALQDQVTEKIVTALEVSLTAEARQERHETKSVEAYDTFLQGWAYYQLRTPDDFAKAVSLFEAAIRLDSDYSRAHAALAGVYWDALQNRWVESWDMPSFRAQSRVEEHMQEAMKSPTPLLHSLSSRMLVSQGLYDDAVSEARQAVALDANDSASYATLANALILAGQPVEGIDLIHKAMRLDPHYSPSYLITLGQAQFGLERFEDAADTFERAVKRNPDDELPWIYLAAAYGHLDRKSEGNSALESANDLRARAALGEMMISDIRFAPRFGASSVRKRVLSGLSELPALTWPSLVSQVGRGSPYEIDTDTAKSMYDRGVPFIDVRTIDQFNAAHIRGAIHLPVFRASPAKTVLTEAALLNVVAKNQEVVIYGGAVRPEYRSTRATAKILAWGYENVYNFTEGWRGWQKASYPIEGK